MKLLSRLATCSQLTPEVKPTIMVGFLLTIDIATKLISSHAVPAKARENLKLSAVIDD